jgi:trk system potassium uptake protein TrkH
MNYSIVRYILGYVLKIEAVFLLVPFVTSLIYHENEGRYYLLIAALCFCLGLFMTVRKPSSTVFYLKEGCLATSLSWIVLSFFGAIPFWMSGEIPLFENALFETVSGFTTTGASILSDVESLSHCALLWRSFTHWIGGMGVLVFLLAILPLSGGSSINLMRAESPGPSVGKLVPKVRYTAMILYAIYFVMTVLELIFLLFGKMPLFDALATSLGTAGTGGFGIKNDSIMSYSPYIQWVIAIFMMLFGINFNAYFFLLYRHFRKAFGMEEVHYYLGIIVVAVLIIFNNIRPLYQSGFTALTHAFFQVCTLITSTGYSSADFDLWPQTSQTILVILMFIGACAGSTGGGIKVSRIVILFKTVVKELNSYIHPKSVKKINMEGKAIEHDVVRSTNVFFITFMIIFSVSVFAISLEGKDLVTNFTAVIATLNNMGPGLALVGPTQNFGHFNVFSKLVLMFDMLAGRLELFPILLLFHPAIWSGLRDTLRKKRA